MSTAEQRQCQSELFTGGCFIDCVLAVGTSDIGSSQGLVLSELLACNKGHILNVEACLARASAVGQIKLKIYLAERQLGRWQHTCLLEGVALSRQALITGGPP